MRLRVGDSVRIPGDGSEPEHGTVTRVIPYSRDGSHQDQYMVTLRYRGVVAGAFLYAQLEKD